ncbi:hypothetical protein PR048_024245 [Dryococelus australis]|uniref:Uncharacterized protein n=1 Tax=Dryococelus australis TaxID=614101 RepID=A0ABQ9GN55_9NEOP|nr:hypothetical protein PR048_024245 [Dryococelus australis]
MPGIFLNAAPTEQMPIADKTKARLLYFSFCTEIAVVVVPPLPRRWWLFLPCPGGGGCCTLAKAVVVVPPLPRRWWLLLPCQGGGGCYSLAKAVVVVPPLPRRVVLFLPCPGGGGCCSLAQAVVVVAPLPRRWWLLLPCQGGGGCSSLAQAVVVVPPLPRRWWLFLPCQGGGGCSSLAQAVVVVAPLPRRWWLFLPCQGGGGCSSLAQAVVVVPPLPRRWWLFLPCPGGGGCSSPLPRRWWLLLPSQGGGGCSSLAQAVVVLFLPCPGGGGCSSLAKAVVVVPPLPRRWWLLLPSQGGGGCSSLAKAVVVVPPLPRRWWLFLPCQGGGGCCSLAKAVVVVPPLPRRWWLFLPCPGGGGCSSLAKAVVVVPPLPRRWWLLLPSQGGGGCCSLAKARRWLFLPCQGGGGCSSLAQAVVVVPALPRRWWLLLPSQGVGGCSSLAQRWWLFPPLPRRWWLFLPCQGGGGCSSLAEAVAQQAVGWRSLPTTFHPRRVHSRISLLGIVPHDAAARWDFSGISHSLSSCIPALLHTHLVGSQVGAIDYLDMVNITEDYLDMVNITEDYLDMVNITEDYLDMVNITEDYLDIREARNIQSAACQERASCYRIIAESRSGGVILYRFLDYLSPDIPSLSLLGLSLVVDSFSNVSAVTEEIHNPPSYLIQCRRSSKCRNARGSSPTPLHSLLNLAPHFPSRRSPRLVAGSAGNGMFLRRQYFGAECIVFQPGCFINWSSGSAIKEAVSRLAPQPGYTASYLPRGDIRFMIHEAGEFDELASEETTCLVDALAQEILDGFLEDTSYRKHIDLPIVFLLGVEPRRDVHLGGPAFYDKWIDEAPVTTDPRQVEHRGGGEYGGWAVSLLASHRGDPGSIISRVTPDLRMRETCWTMPLVGGFSWGSTVSPAPSFRHCSLLPSLTLFTHYHIGSIATSPPTRRPPTQGARYPRGARETIIVHYKYDLSRMHYLETYYLDMSETTTGFCIEICFKLFASRMIGLHLEVICYTQHDETTARQFRALRSWLGIKEDLDMFLGNLPPRGVYASSQRTNSSFWRTVTNKSPTNHIPDIFNG